jgi:hypothetical protein
MLLLLLFTAAVAPTALGYPKQALAARVNLTKGQVDAD